MKPVIDALREGRKSWSDLEKIAITLSENDERKIPEKTLDRILKDYLEPWGLVHKDNDFWVWYENLRIFRSNEEYELMVEHSRKLVPALQNMLLIYSKDRHVYYSAAKEHLRSYPAIYQRLEAFELAFNDRVRELFEKYGKYIKTPDQFMVLDYVKVPGKGPLGRIFSQTRLKKRDLPYAIEYPDLPNIKNREGFEKTVEFREIKELTDFLDDTEAFSKRFENYGELAGEITKLSLRVEMGQPLEGTCSLCPKVRIIDGAS